MRPLGAARATGTARAARAFGTCGSSRTRRSLCPRRALTRLQQRRRVVQIDVGTDPRNTLEHDLPAVQSVATSCTFGANRTSRANWPRRTLGADGANRTCRTRGTDGALGTRRTVLTILACLARWALRTRRAGFTWCTLGSRSTHRTDGALRALRAGLTGGTHRARRTLGTRGTVRSGYTLGPRRTARPLGPRGTHRALGPGRTGRTDEVTRSELLLHEIDLVTQLRQGRVPGQLGADELLLRRLQRARQQVGGLVPAEEGVALERSVRERSVDAEPRHALHG